MFYLRVTRGGPDFVFLTMCWEFAGEAMKLGTGTNPSDWAYHHGGGKVRIRWADDADVPDYWNERHQEVYGVPFDNSVDGGLLVEPRGVVRFQAAGSGFISTAETDDCWGSCIFPLSKPDLIAAVFGQTIADALAIGPDWDGSWTQPLDWVGEQQVDPRTLTTVIEGGVALVDQVLIQDAAFNDLVHTLGGGDG